MHRPGAAAPARLVRGAAFYRPKRREDFDYDSNPAISPAYVNQLADPGWVLAGKPLCLTSNSGTGKSHLLIDTATAEAGLRVRYTTTANLVNELAEARAERRLSRSLARYTRYDPPCLDEFGYLNSTAPAPRCCSRSSPSGRNARSRPGSSGPRSSHLVQST